MKMKLPCFDRGILLFVYQRKQVKMRWVQEPSQRNVDKLNSVRREAS